MSVIPLDSRRDDTDVVRLWHDRIRRAREARRSYEPVWRQSLAFAAGKHYLKWNPVSGELEMPADLAGRELYVAEIIGEYRMAALGELAQDEDRPQLLLVRDDQWSEDLQSHANLIVGYGWEHEWEAEYALMEARRYCIDLGTSAVRCVFDPSAGPPLQRDVPFRDGQAVLDEEAARSYVADTVAAGGVADLRTVNEGRTRWQPLSAFNLLPPPGVWNEHDFPWEIVVRPTPLTWVRDVYGDGAAGLREDTDIGGVFGHDNAGDPVTPGASSGGDAKGKLRDHVWLYTCYERPTSQWPEGQTFVFAGSPERLLSHTPKLPCVRVDGTPWSGVEYLHWERVTGRFFSRGPVEKLKDPQRLINRRRTQSVEIVDRAMPQKFVEEGALPQRGRGLPWEIVEIRKGAARPEFFNGSGPGEWMYRDVEEFRQDAEHAAGIRAVRLGDNPVNVTTYAQLAQLNENDQIKRVAIFREHRKVIARLVEYSVEYARRYWPENKHLTLAGDEGQLQAVTFRKSMIPDFYVVRAATGAAKPRTQAAQLALIQDIARYAADSGQPLPVSWFKESIEAGQPLDLPSAPGNVHLKKAERENHLMLEHGEPAPVDYFDPHELHIGAHRTAQVDAELAGNIPAFLAFESHIQAHVQAGADAAARFRDLAGAPVDGPAATAQGAAPEQRQEA